MCGFMRHASASSSEQRPARPWPTPTGQPQLHWVVDRAEADVRDLLLHLTPDPDSGFRTRIRRHPESMQCSRPRHLLVAAPVKQSVRRPKVAIGVRGWNGLTPFLAWLSWSLWQAPFGIAPLCPHHTRHVLLRSSLCSPSIGREAHFSISACAVPSGQNTGSSV